MLPRKQLSLRFTSLSCANWDRSLEKLPVLSGRQNYLARVPTLFYIGLCLADLCEREALVHMGADPAIRDALQQYFHPARDHVGLVPHVPEVYAEG